MKKIILLTTVLITGVPVSCDFYEPGTYQIENIEATVGRFESDSSTRFEKINFTRAGYDTINANQLVIEVSIANISIVADASKFSFLPSAFADPIPDGSGNTISLISIYAEESIFSGGTEYKPGESLTNLFSIQSSSNESKESILKFIQEFDLWDSNNNLFLQFKTSLDKPLTQEIKLEFTFENGKVIPFITKKIVVK